MIDGRETTVTKCPACGAVTPGMPEQCPACSHRFSVPGTSLPILREPTRKMDTIPIRRKPVRHMLPRHVTVPFLAGLLVAVVVLVLLRLAASDHKATGTAGDASPGQTVAGGNPASSVEAAGSMTAGHSATPPVGEFPALLHLGPGAVPAVPDDIRYFRLVSNSEQSAGTLMLRLDDLMDGNVETCLLPELSGLPGRIELVFPRYYRFSHVTITVGCLRGPAAARVSKVAVETEGGIHRTVLLPTVEGPVTADLAGSWTSRIVIRLDDPGLSDLGLAELRFFVFRKEGDEPES